MNFSLENARPHRKVSGQPLVPQFPAPKEENPFDGVNCGIPRGNLLGVDCRRRRPSAYAEEKNIDGELIFQ